GSSFGLLYAAQFPSARPWSYAFGDSITARPVVDAYNHTYAGDASGTVRCLDAAGNQRWAQALGAAVEAEMAGEGSRLYVAAGGHLFALSVSTGDVVFNLDLGGPTGAMSAPVIALGRVIYLTRADGHLLAVAEGWMHLSPEAVGAEMLPGGRAHV